MLTRLLLFFLFVVSSDVMARDPFRSDASLNLPVSQPVIIREHWYPLHHQSVQRVSALLISTLGKLAGEEAVVSDDLRNGLWLQLSDCHWRQAQRYLPRWDVASTQVDMVAYIVDMDSSVMDELGVQWRQSAPSSSGGRSDSLTTDMLQDSGVATVQIGVMSRKILALQLSALEHEGKGAIIARPHLLIEDNKEAVIEAGTEVPYSEKTKSGATSASFKKAVLRLKVRPHCLPDQRLLLDLEVNHDKVSSLNVQGTPAIETQRLTTGVAVSSGQIVVLGGLFTVTQSQQMEQLPVLGDLPLLGGLFRWRSQHLSRKELLVFISPRIL